MGVLDPASETFALDVVSVIEATLEDPRLILAAQLKKARGEAIAAMKADGIEYDERMELLDEITYSRPLGELLGHAFEVYLRSNPWAADAQRSPIRRARNVGAGGWAANIISSTAATRSSRRPSTTRRRRSRLLRHRAG